MSTLEQLLNMKVRADTMQNGKEVFITPDFRITVQKKTLDGIHIIIHPMGHNGETLDFIVRDNTLIQL